MRRIDLSVMVLLLASGIVGAQRPATAPSSRPAAGAGLSVSGEGLKPVQLTRQNLAAMPRTEVRVKDHSGVDAVYSGVRVGTILKSAGAPLGNNQLRGPNLALYVVALASDGYRVVYSLVEFDDEFGQRNIIVADTRDGQPLNEQEGPLRIIVPDDEKFARWIRQLISLKLAVADAGANPP